MRLLDCGDRRHDDISLVRGVLRWTGELERSLRHDLNTARYFVVIRAYDLKGRVPSVRKNPSLTRAPTTSSVPWAVRSM